MDISKILGEIKGKILDAAHFDLLKRAYDLQNENIEQLKSNNEAFKESNSLLEKENRSIREENQKLKTENHQLKMNFQNTTDVDVIDEIEKKILILLSSSDQELIPQTIAYRIGCNLTKVEYYLEKMYKSKFLCSHDYCNGQPSEYYLLQKGREYLIKNNLLD